VPCRGKNIKKHIKTDSTDRNTQANTTFRLIHNFFIPQQDTKNPIKGQVVLSHQTGVRFPVALPINLKTQ
jgi:hypothetical protein